MKTAFVTGATGFLGVNLINTLLQEKWEVYALVIPEDPIKYLNEKRITFVKGDVMNKSSLRKAIPKGKDVTVFHVAGLTSMWHKQDEIQYRINVVGTRNVCEVAIEKNVKRFVFTSSISAYGYHSKTVTEKTISNASTCKMNYNYTKYLGEQEIHKAIKNGLDAVILNPCNVVGPYDVRGWSTLIKSANKGNPKGATDGIATFSHVQDVIDAHISAVENGITGENYLLGGVEVSFKDAVTTICQMLDKPGPKKSISPSLLKVVMVIQAVKSFFDKKMPLLTYPRYKRLTGHIVCDDSKARNTLNYKTRSLEEMFKDSYNWLKKEDLL